MAMSDHEKRQIEEKAREDARTGNYTSDSAFAAVYRGYGTSGHISKTYQDAFKKQQQEARRRRERK